MKLGNHDISALAKKLFHHNQGAKRAKLMHPNRDWLIGVLLGMMIIIIMIGWSAYTYLEKRDALELADTNVEPVVPVYNADTVQDALELYARRDEVFTQLTQPNASITDQVIDPAVDSASTTTSSTTDQIIEEESVTEVVTEEDGEEQAIISPAPTSTEPTPENDVSTEAPTLIN